MELELNHHALPIIHALDSETRIEIVNQLAKHPMTVTALAQSLHYSKTIISKHLKVLESANIINSVPSTTNDRRQKYMAVRTEQILINLPEKIYPEFQRADFDIPVGNYFANTGIQPSCGLADPNQVIGEMDDPNVFLAPERMQASLLWFSKGSVEYMIPNAFKLGRHPEMIDISFEAASEYPGSNNNWPSDISFWVNDVLVGCITIPANYSDVRGQLTPSWWPSKYSQYGLLKHLRIHTDNTGCDAQQISSITLADLHLEQDSALRFRIGIDPTSPHQGGLTLFGYAFGNYAQDIHVSCFYSCKD